MQPLVPLCCTALYSAFFVCDFLSFYSDFANPFLLARTPSLRRTPSYALVLSAAIYLYKWKTKVILVELLQLLL